MAATRTIEYHSNDTTYQESDRLRRWRGIRGERELRSEQSWSFQWESGQLESSPGIMADLCAFSTWCVLYSFIKIHRRGACNKSNTQSFFTPVCVYTGAGGYSSLSRVHYSWLTCSTHLTHGCR